MPYEGPYIPDDDTDREYESEDDTDDDSTPDDDLPEWWDDRMPEDWYEMYDDFPGEWEYEEFEIGIDYGETT